MIIAQSILIQQKHLPEIITLLETKGYEISNYQSDILDFVAFDVFNEEFLSFFRFECSSIGDITGIRSTSIDDVGLGDILQLIYPFVEKEGYIFTTGEHQCELEGYYLRPDGVYEADNIVVIANIGKKLEQL